MILTFDTSVLIDLENRNEKTLQKIQALTDQYPGTAHLTFIAYLEFYEGIVERSPVKYDMAWGFLQRFPFLQPTKTTAEKFVEIKKKYARKGIQLPLGDFLIASQVQEHNLVLVTKDNDFERIDEIRKIII